MTTTVRIAAVKRVPMDSMRKPALVAGSGSARRRVLRPCFEAPRLGVEAPAAAMPCPDAPTPRCSERFHGDTWHLRAHVIGGRFARTARRPLRKRTDTGS